VRAAVHVAVQQAALDIMQRPCHVAVHHFSDKKKTSETANYLAVSEV